MASLQYITLRTAGTAHPSVLAGRLSGVTVLAATAASIACARSALQVGAVEPRPG